MKKLVTLLFLFITFLGFGQSVSAPDPKSFIVSTAGQDASGFSLSGFSSTATLLASISLVNPPSGTTFYLTTSTGLVAASGFNFNGNKTKLVFTGTMANINSALATLKINTGSIKGDINISVAATVNPTGFYYNGTNGHFYKPVPTGANFANAITAARNSTFKGQTGYLVTITSADEDLFIYNNVPQSNIWFAADDRTTEGRWVISDGPEAGTLLRIGNGGGVNQQGVYNNWANGEPNDWGGNEDAAVTKWGGGSQWNDLSTANVNPYVIEYGTWTNPDDATFTEFYSNSVAHSNGETLKLLFGFKFGSSVDKTKFSANVVKRNDTTLPWVSAGDYKSLSGLGKVYLSNQLDTAKVFSSGIQLVAGTTDMTAFSTADIGKVYKVTITATGGGGVWGTDIYTNDSYIPAAAQHAGVITAGQTKEVYIKIVEGLNDYPASTRNGITTSAWGGWGLSYQFVAQPSSFKATGSPGQVEWCVIYDYDASNQRYRVGIDKREFTGTNVASNSITKLKLFDLWDGAATFKSDDGTWAEYWIYTPTQFNYVGSSYSSNLRAGNGFYGVSAEFAFTQMGEYKQHKLQLKEYDSAQLKTLYNSIVTVSDVWLAFKEVANNGIFGNEMGKEFTYGIQYKNADVDNNGVFNEADCFKLLQNLTGVTDLFSSYTLDNTLHIIPDSTYNTIGKSNWSSFQLFSGREYPFSLVDGETNYNYDLAIAFKGDVNLSHSAIPPSNGLTTMSVRTMSTTISNDVNASILTELSNGKFYAYITFDPLQQEVVGNQFQLNYDNSVLKFESVEFKTKGNPMNYGTNKGSYINLGSLATDGSTLLDKTTEYKVIFTPIKSITNGLGLIGIGTTDAVNKAGKQLNVKIN